MFVFVRRLGRRQYSFLESLDVGLAPLFPVISVIADRYDSLRSRDLSLPQPKHILEPVEPCDRTRLAPGVVLVVCHQDHVVYGGRELAIVERVVVDRKVDRDFASCRV